MKRILNLKTWLLQHDLVEENDYLEKYLNLLQLNLNTKVEKYVTQAHHAIPVVYYKQTSALKQDNRNRRKYEAMAAADENNFIVNLKYSDHLLAHCYLALCAKPDWFKFANANMITVVSKHTNLEAFAKTEDLEAYQEAYTLSCKLKANKHLTEEHKRKIAASHNRSAEYSRKISEANSRRVWTEASKKKLSESIKNSEKCIKSRYGRPSHVKGKFWMTNGTNLLRVSKDEIQTYLQMGYWLGRTTTLKIRKGYEEIIICAKDWPIYEAQGWKKSWKLSKELKNKLKGNN